MEAEHLDAYWFLMLKRFRAIHNQRKWKWEWLMGATNQWKSEKKHEMVTWASHNEEKRWKEGIFDLTGRTLFVCQNCRALQLIWSFFSIKASEPSNFNQWLAHHSHIRLAWPTDGRLLQGSPSSFSISQEHDLGHRSGFCHGQYVATCCPTCCIDSNTEAIAKISKSPFSRLWLSVAQDSGTAHGAKHKTFPANPSSSHRSKSWSSRRHKKPLRRTCRDTRTFTTELFVAKQQCFRLCLGSTRSWWQKLTCEALI